MMQGIELLFMRAESPAWKQRTPSSLSGPRLRHPPVVPYKKTKSKLLARRGRYRWRYSWTELGSAWSRLSSEVTVVEFHKCIGGAGIDEEISCVHLPFYLQCFYH